MAKHIGAREARTRFSDIIGSVRFGNEEVILERSGKPMAAIIPIETYERLVAERRARFEVLYTIRSHLPDIPQDKIDVDIADAISKVRANSVTSGS